jgi:hypothetical protein
MDPLIARHPRLFRYLVGFAALAALLPLGGMEPATRAPGTATSVPTQQRKCAPAALPGPDERVSECDT